MIIMNIRSLLYFKVIGLNINTEMFQRDDRRMAEKSRETLSQMTSEKHFMARRAHMSQTHIESKFL